MTTVIMGTMANSEDPDERPNNAAFHQGLHCLPRQIDLQRKKYNQNEIITCDASIYILRENSLAIIYNGVSHRRSLKL